MNYLNKIYTYTEGYRRVYFLSTLAVFGATVFSLLTPLIIKYIIDIIIQNFDLSDSYFEKSMDFFVGKSLLNTGILIFFVAFFQGGCLYFKGKLSSIASEGIVKTVKDKLYTQLQNVKYSYFNKVETGDLLQRCTSDVETIRKFLAIQLVEVVNIILMIIIIFFILINLNLKLSIIVLSIIPLMFIFSLYFFIVVKKYFKISDEAEAKLSTILQENIHGVRVVKAFASEDLEIKKFRCSNKHYSHVTYKLIRLFAYYWPISSFFSFVQMGLVLFLGIKWAVSGTITMGTVIAFGMYVWQLEFPVRNLGRILSDFGKASISFERIEEILDSETDFNENENLKKPQIKGKIVFENVRFSYIDKPILNGISFDLDIGETLGILGPTGSGKSSLIHLITRLYDYDSGSIKIDGVELKEIDKKWIRKNIGLVLQETFLFAKNVRENIGITKKILDDCDIFTAAKTASIHEGILNFKEGYETQVGEKGVSLSGGQKQRIAIARTIINNHKILIFDDSLSAVDIETDASIRRELKKKHSSSTTIIISHRISSIMDADKIMVLEGGKISAYGTHNQLKDRDGLYKRILKIQKDGMKEGI
ncbi:MULTISPECIES: ABC transporter ATP-binding protein [Psychrilyobacter]|uniref:ATP-binding cassette domain-containing protein n=1 Tax=Psychrilyobacter piezotolerans TaxID=2293438 RepID=A0ABX9KHP6_9FUSO|nr:MULTISPECIES: ABC transporter ATP-binding protein [Psychrilyobacter]MCS5421450.1 ABC transporter ATP-binding protein/permease [Psychrilyobacter sp. S5]NDI77798.1 ABC transporter ATP-binding protein [Psychrilyobacter piezotolerans]RDE62349.1 ABC transporter ATP-binding protein [Psychrilyobacter sp. S5]REI41447.1 ATP-binding cassette domain-containing protein [Psychrilyobacter piezotolerans]